MASLGTNGAICKLRLTASTAESRQGASVLRQVQDNCDIASVYVPNPHTQAHPSTPKHNVALTTLLHSLQSLPQPAHQSQHRTAFGTAHTVAARLLLNGTSLQQNPLHVARKASTSNGETLQAIVAAFNASKTP